MIRRQQSGTLTDAGVGTTRYNVLGWARKLGLSWIVERMVVKLMVIIR